MRSQPVGWALPMQNQSATLHAWCQCPDDCFQYLRGFHIRNCARFLYGTFQPRSPRGRASLRLRERLLRLTTAGVDDQEREEGDGDEQERSAVGGRVVELLD